MSSAATAPTVDAGVANKKYVDDNIGAANYTPTTYAGEESVTFPNGFILKFGYVTRSGANQVVTFGTAFPTAVIARFVTPRDEGEQNISYAPFLSDVSTTSMDINCSDATVDGYYWAALGY